MSHGMISIAILCTLLSLAHGAVAAQSNYAFQCDSGWLAWNGIARCGSIGGIQNVLEVADAGGWSHAYQELELESGAVYRLTTELYAEVEGECDGSVPVTWCSPSVVVCPGKYDAEFYRAGGCYLGLHTTGKGAWEAVAATFTATTSRATIYVPQESTTYSSWARNLQISIVQERLLFFSPIASQRVGTTARLRSDFAV